MIPPPNTNKQIVPLPRRRQMRDPHRALQVLHLALSAQHTHPLHICLLDNTQRPYNKRLGTIVVAASLDLALRRALPRVGTTIAHVLVLVGAQFAACWRRERVFEDELLF